MQNPVGMSQWKKLLEFQAVSHKEPTHRHTQTHSLWAPAPGYQLERHQWHTGQNWSVWHQGESWGTAFSQAERQAEALVPFLSPTFTEPQNWQVSTISETPSNWLTLLALPRRSPETLSYPNYKPTQDVNHDFPIWMTGLGSCFTTS